MATSSILNRLIKVDYLSHQKRDVLSSLAGDKAPTPLS